MSIIRLTAGLIGFERENCATCPPGCLLDTTARDLGVNADHLRTIGHGVCPFHADKDILPRARHAADVLDMTQPQIRDGAVLVQRIAHILSA